MIKHAIHIIKGLMLPLVAGLAMSSLSSCSSNDEPESNPSPNSKVVPRTIMVYMVANNNLSSNARSDLNEMKKAAANGDFGDGRLVVYHSSSAGIVLKEVTATSIDTLKVYPGDLNSVSISTLSDVVDDVKHLAPANDYGIIFWGHGSGWYQDGIKEVSGQQRSYGYDVDKNNWMDITSMAKAIEGKDFAFIYFDCCFMGNIETLYELRNTAKYFISSPAEIHADGMPYDKSVKYLFGKDLRQAMIQSSKQTFDYYYEMFYESYYNRCPITMNVVDASQLEPLAVVTKEVMLAAENSYDTNHDYQRYGVGRYVDSYYDMDDYISSICADESLYLRWREAFDKAVIYKEAGPYIWDEAHPINHYSGLSTYILTSDKSANNNNYNTLSWYDDVASHLFN